MLHDSYGRWAQILALVVPAFLLGGAYISQYGFGLYPCEMCWWQRYPHFVALVLALVSFVSPAKRVLIGLAGLAILFSGLIGAYHAGVEYSWWQGMTACSAEVFSNSADAMDAIMNAPVIRCNDVQWSLFGISLAGWNFCISTGGAIAIFVLLGKGKRAQ